MSCVVLFRSSSFLVTSSDPSGQNVKMYQLQFDTWFRVNCLFHFYLRSDVAMVRYTRFVPICSARHPNAEPSKPLLGYTHASQISFCPPPIYLFINTMELPFANFVRPQLRPTSNNHANGKAPDAQIATGPGTRSGCEAGILLMRKQFRLGAPSCTGWVNSGQRRRASVCRLAGCANQ